MDQIPQSSVRHCMLSGHKNLNQNQNPFYFQVGIVTYKEFYLAFLRCVAVNIYTQINAQKIEKEYRIC